MYIIVYTNNLGEPFLDSDQDGCIEEYCDYRDAKAAAEAEKNEDPVEFTDYKIYELATA
jgi:hypothetical protein